MKIFKAISATITIFILYVLIQIAAGFFAPDKMIYSLKYSEHVLFIAHIGNLILVSIVFYFLSKQYKSRKEPGINVNVLLILPFLAGLLFIVNDPVFRFENIFNLAPLPEKGTMIIIKESIVLLINSLILAPIVEELVFRELIFRVTFNQVISWKIWLVISTLCFALIHIDSIESFVAALIMGFVLGIIYMKQGILYSIVAHLFYNIFWLFLHVKNDVYLSALNKLNFGLGYFTIVVLCLAFMIYILFQLPQNYLKQNSQSN